MHLLRIKIAYDANKIEKKKINFASYAYTWSSSVSAISNIGFVRATLREASKSFP